MRLWLTLFFPLIWCTILHQTSNVCTTSIADAFWGIFQYSQEFARNRLSFAAPFDFHGDNGVDLGIDQIGNIVVFVSIVSRRPQGIYSESDGTPWGRRQHFVLFDNSVSG